ncbi:hypothetical protein AAFF_G00109550 [Aldrovandia affinis]|uniref:Uncharacterized protein n=1 Tax=Aldrovandia affinis TaxID=143900 RepID=A0AAD7RWB1_9TELE|nr:hypothetical protein AAFF_G00109550 [Aldrovandia affinis]
MSVSLEELCALVNVPYEKARLLQQVIDGEADEEGHDKDDVIVEAAEDLHTAGVGTIEQDENGPAKKRKDQLTWKNVRKRRMEGKSYISKRQNGGEIVKLPRNMGPGCESTACQKSSKRNCKMITEEDRQGILKFFW